MSAMRNLMLGAAIAVGAAGLGASSAKAAEFGIYARGPVAYVPPCPGPGYAWVAGYYSNGYWVPGFWRFGGGPVFHGGPVYRYDHYRDFGRDHFRGFDHGHFRR